MAHKQHVEVCNFPDPIVTKESISEIEICVNGVTAIQKTVIDSAGVEVVTYKTTNGSALATPASFTYGRCNEVELTANPVYWNDNGVCTEGKAWYNNTTGALVRINKLDGTDVTATVSPNSLNEGAIPTTTSVWHDTVAQTGFEEIPVTPTPNPSYAGTLLSYGVAYTQAQANANNLLSGGTWNIPAGVLGLGQAQWASFNVQLPYIPECATNIRIKASANYSATLVSGAPNGIGDGDAYMMLAATNISPISYPSNLLMGWDYNSNTNTAPVFGSNILPIPPASTSVKIVMWSENANASGNPIFDNTFSSVFSNLQVSILYDIDGCPKCIDVIRNETPCGVTWTDVNGDPHTPNEPQSGSCATELQVAQVPNCAGTFNEKPVDSIVGAYVLNQENKHTEKVYDVLTAVFGGTIAYTYNTPLEVILSYSGVTIANDTLRYFWTDFGDGYNDVGANPSHTYNSDGSYEIKSYGVTLSGNKILLIAKEVNILNGVITYAPTNLPQPVSATYKILVSSALQDYCGSLLVDNPYNADGTPYTLIGDFDLEKPIIIDELEDNADYQATIAYTTTQRIHQNFVVTGTTPLVIPAGAISISVTKTNNTGVVNISGDNGTNFPLTFNRENFTDSVNEAVSTLSAYTITGTLAGTTYKVHIIR